MNKEREEKNERPVAYPRPTETDQQLKNQPEYIDQQPNDMTDKSISNMPVSGGQGNVANDPENNG